MTISYVNVGTASTGSTSLTPSFPAVTAGNILFLFVANKYPGNGPATPSGWTLIGQGQGGAGSSGADSGQTFLTAFYKIATGSESGTLSVSIPSGNSARAAMIQFSKTEGSWHVFSQTAADNSAGASWSMSSAAAMRIETGDAVLAACAINTDTYTFSSNAIAASGVTFDTVFPLLFGNSTTGDDCRLQVDVAAVTGGGGPSTVTYTATASGSNANGPAGGGLIIVFREADSYTFDCEAGSFTLSGQAATLSWGTKIDADRGQFTLAGNDATLTNGYGIVAEMGAFTLTGRDAALTSVLAMAADAGAFTLTGNDAGLSVGYQVTAEVGSFTLTGLDASLVLSAALAAETGAYALAGFDLGAGLALTLDAEAGAYVLVGQDVEFRFSGWSDVPAAGEWADQATTATWTVQSGTGTWTVQSGTATWTIQPSSGGWTVQ